MWLSFEEQEESYVDARVSRSCRLGSHRLLPLQPQKMSCIYAPPVSLTLNCHINLGIKHLQGASGVLKELVLFSINNVFLSIASTWRVHSGCMTLLQELYVDLEHSERRLGMTRCPQLPERPSRYTTEGHLE